MRTRAKVAALACWPLALLLAGCGEKVKGKREAEATAERYYTAIAAGDAEAAVALVDPSAFEHTPREQLVQFLRQARERLGEYQGRAPTGFRVGTFYTDTGETISRLVLTYHVRYALHEADESLTFLTGDGPPRFVGTFIISPTLQPGGPPGAGLRRAAAAVAGAWVEAFGRPDGK
jgi:hypothetical protein